jgi:hypothetical protein
MNGLLLRNRCAVYHPRKDIYIRVALLFFEKNYMQTIFWFVRQLKMESLFFLLIFFACHFTALKEASKVIVGLMNETFEMWKMISDSLSLLFMHLHVWNLEMQTNKLKTYTRIVLVLEIALESFGNFGCQKFQNWLFYEFYILLILRKSPIQSFL